MLQTSLSIAGFVGAALLLVRARRTAYLNRKEVEEYIHTKYGKTTCRECSSLKQDVASGEVQVRVYDAQGRRLRAGCVCVKRDDEFGGNPRILLISGMTDKANWSLPGGGVDPGELPRNAASRGSV